MEDGIFQTLGQYLAFPFVQNALVAGTLIALCASLLGVPLVLRRFSYIGDGLSHVAFSVMAVAAIFGLSNNMFLVLPATIVCAVLLLHGGDQRKIKGDAAIAMLSVGSLAVGYLLLSKFSPSANFSGDVCGTLFGSTSILTLSRTDVILCVGLSIVVLLAFVFFYNRIFALTFDETFAKAGGVKTGFFNLLLAVLIAVVIVLAMNLVGALLISAFVIFPVLSAMGICKSFRSVTITSACLSVFCAVMGMLVSILAGTPVGSTIVAIDIAVFLLFRLIASFCGEKKS